MTATTDATDSSTVEKLSQAVKDLQQTIEQQAERITDLENKLAAHKDHTGREFADVRGRITGVENQQTEAALKDENPTSDADREGSTDKKTPLETICALPEHMAARELTANQERARFIATDVRDYAEKVPAGLVIDSQAIKRVITAKEGTRPHTQTVARVMNFLDELGADGVELKKRRGRKLVVFEPEVADRLADHSRCDRPQEEPPTTGVITS